MRIITVKVDEDLLNEIDLLAMNQRLSRSDIIREAIKFYLKAKEQERIGLAFRTIVGEAHDDH